MFKIQELIDPSKNCVFSCVNENMENKATMVLHNEEVSLFFEDGSPEEKFGKDYDKMLARASELGLQFIKVIEGNSHWKEFNPNPKKRNIGDCTLRAYCAAFGIDWEEAFDLASKIAKENSSMIQYVSDKILQEHFGCTIDEKYNKKTVKGKDRITVNEFALQHPYGKYVLHVRGHLVAVIDGRFYDSWDSGKKKIDTVYIVH